MDLIYLQFKVPDSYELPLTYIIASSFKYIFENRNKGIINPISLKAAILAGSQIYDTNLPNVASSIRNAMIHFKI